MSDPHADDPWVSLDRMADNPSERAALLEEIAVLMGRDTFAVAEGQLRIDVPLPAALDHVPASVLRSAVGLARSYACILLRAAVTMPEGFSRWAAGHGDVCDLPGQRLQLFDDGRIGFHLGCEPRDDVLNDIEQPRLDAGISPNGVAGAVFDQVDQEVAEENLLRAQDPSLNLRGPLFVRFLTHDFFSLNFVFSSAGAGDSPVQGVVGVGGQSISPAEMFEAYASWASAEAQRARASSEDRP